MNSSTKAVATIGAVVVGYGVNVAALYGTANIIGHKLAVGTAMKLAAGTAAAGLAVTFVMTMVMASIEKNATANP